MVSRYSTPQWKRRVLGNVTRKFESRWINRELRRDFGIGFWVRNPGERKRAGSKKFKREMTMIYES